MDGTFSGGTAASFRVTQSAAMADRSFVAVLKDAFAPLPGHAETQPGVRAVAPGVLDGHPNRAAQVDRGDGASQR
jgi:hypothetical protein